MTSKSVTVGDASEFYEVTLPETNVIEILSVEDSDGNSYYEVPYLAQDTIAIEETNDYENNPIYSKFATLFLIF